MTQLTGQAYVERYGHEWYDADRAREYVERNEREENPRAEGFQVMIGVVPFNKTDAFRVLDIGSGQGNVAALVLDAFPNATAVGLDVSEPMRDLAAERMGRFGNRFSYQLGDFVDGELPVTGTFDVVVSSRAIHHLPTPNKQRLYAAIFRSLNPGGAFFNLDSVGPTDEDLRRRYRIAGRAMRGEPAAQDGGDRGNRPPSPGHYFEPLDEQLSLLRTAGFTAVDCFWKRLGMTLLGGYKRA
jgi:tRNA (cmo5U34)-methyltransferase